MFCSDLREQRISAGGTPQKRGSVSLTPGKKVCRTLCIRCSPDHVGSRPARRPRPSAVRSRRGHTVPPRRGSAAGSHPGRRHALHRKRHGIRRLDLYREPLNRTNKYISRQCGFICLEQREPHSRKTEDCSLIVSSIFTNMQTPAGALVIKPGQSLHDNQ